MQRWGNNKRNENLVLREEKEQCDTPSVARDGRTVVCIAGGLAWLPEVSHERGDYIRGFGCLLSRPGVDVVIRHLLRRIRGGGGGGSSEDQVTVGLA